MPVLTAADIFVKEAELMMSGRSGTPFNADGEREYTADFLVLCKIKDVTDITVCACPGCPLPYSPHPSDLAALCVSLSAKPKLDDDWGSWIVTAKWSTRMPEGGPRTGDTAENAADDKKGPQNNPELEPPDIEWDFETVTRAPPKDLDGLPFLNSARQPYTPAPSFEFASAVLVMSRNELDYSRTTASYYAFSVNKFKFLGADPGTVQCMPPKAKLMYRGSITYWRVSYRLRFGEELDDGTLRPWDPVEVLDSGLMELAPIPGSKNAFTLVPITARGHPVSQPVCLNGQGRQQKPIFEGNFPDPFTGKLVPSWVLKQSYNKYRLRRAVDFAKLLRSGLAARL